MKRKIGILILAAVCLCSFCAAYSEKILADIEKSGIVRLHIIANSNSEDDQKLKLELRDELIKSGVFNGEVDLDKVNNICNEKIKTRGKNYTCKSMVGKFYFPTKNYKNISLPAGNYNALRVVLGAGKGENWWCVMYPPLCFTEDATGELSKENEEKLKEMMTKESYNLVSNDNVELVPAFKIVEIWQEIKCKIF